jgi:hypothetical protein
LWKRQQYITDEASTDPIGAAKAVQALPYLAGNASGVTDTTAQLVQGDSDEGQLSWNAAIPFIQTPSTTADTAGGWQMIPQMEGFTLNRSWEVVPGAVMPFYITAGADPSQVKRAIITYPGKPRDCWKYGNLFRNALSVVYANETYGVANGSVIIISPMWMNNLDNAAGGTQAGELWFNGSAWEYGGASGGPKLTHSIDSYSVMDNFTDMLFDTAQWPAMNQVVIAGHSMGGQATHRYAILKKQKKYDNNMSYWMGNPGSWTYLSTQRPYYNQSCTDTYDTWEYGIGGNQTKIPKYARKDVETNKQDIVNRYLGRKCHMALGLLDNGPGDTHCQARDQGGNHLDRGSNYVLHLANISNGVFPSSMTVDFIGNTSHQDYAMISANQSLYWLFVNDYNNKYPDIVPSNPGDKNHTSSTTPKPKSYATHGNEALASALLGGSLLFIFLVFSVLPLLFRSNFDERAFESQMRSRAQVFDSGKGVTSGFAASNSAANNFSGFTTPTYAPSDYKNPAGAGAYDSISSSTPLTHFGDYDNYNNGQHDVLPPPPAPRWANSGSY